MIQERAIATASCEGCGKSYRVPDLSRTYRCKACGGAVRSTQDDASVDRATLERVRRDRAHVDAHVITCPECLALNDTDAEECVACEAQLDALEEDAEAIAVRRHEVNDELRSAHQWIGAVTWAYRIGALAYGLATLFAVTALARTDVPVGGGVLVVGLTTLLSALLLMGAIHILFQPFVWTLVIAVLATAVSVVHYVGPNPLGLGLVGSAAWAALAWLALIPTFKFRQLMQRHKDLYILHHASAQTRRSLKGHTAEERHDRLISAMQRAAWRAWRGSFAVAASIAVVSTVGAWVVLNQFRPQVLDSTLDRFESAWAASDLPGVVSLFDPNVQEQRAAWLDGAFEGHGWRASFPALAERALEREDRRASVRYERADFTLETSWILNGQVWTLLELSVPVPPLEPLTDGFQRAWNESDPAAMVQFFDDDAREPMRERIASSAAGRGWVTFPPIVDTKLGKHDDGNAMVKFELERDTTGGVVAKVAPKVTTQWNLGADGRWRLYALEFPTKYSLKDDPQAGGETPLTADTGN